MHVPHLAHAVQALLAADFLRDKHTMRRCLRRLADIISSGLASHASNNHRVAGSIWRAVACSLPAHLQQRLCKSVAETVPVSYLHRVLASAPVSLQHIMLAAAAMRPTACPTLHIQTHQYDSRISQSLGLAAVLKSMTAQPVSKVVIDNHSARNSNFSSERSRII